ncbi:MerR family transcriptional regulator [Flavobacterium circumlabens]|uniref:MerR family transcriptional regulator n=1 Tax=Flavobacterium circumlabens TaxID=2133765 RepID=UPI001EDD9B39|nr:MerR family transcriptional regulator [Flavobacterium circumlabens]
MRFYGKSALIACKKKSNVKSNNYGYYDEEVITKLKLIKDPKSVGFTLSEIKELIDAWYSNHITKAKKN